MDAHRLRVLIEKLRKKGDAPNLRHFDFRDRSGEEASLWKPQRLGAAFLCLSQRSVLGDVTGSGKTLQILAALDKVLVQEKPEQVVITTVNSARSQWQEQTERFLGFAPPIVEGGKPKERKAFYSEVAAGEHPVVIIGWALLRRDVEYWTGLLRERSTTLVLDEAMNRTAGLRNLQSKTYKALLKLSRLSYRVHGISATVSQTLGPLGFYNVFKIVNPQVFGTRKANFVESFCAWESVPWISNPTPRGQRREWHGEPITGYRNLDLLRHRLLPYYLRRSKKTFERYYPPLREKVCRIDLKPWEREAYEEAEEGLGTDCTLNGINFAVQAASCVALLDERRDEVTDPKKCSKIEEFLRILDDELADDDIRVCVYSRSKRLIGIVGALLDAREIEYGRITGDEGDKERTRVRHAFDRGDLRFVLFTDAGGEALNLQAADVLILFDCQWKLGDHNQIVGRVHRPREKKDQVLAIMLVARGTIDEDILRGLRAQARLSKRVERQESETMVNFTTKDLGALISERRSK